MISAKHLRHHVVRPTLKHLGLWSVGAEELVLGTCAQESACGRYLRQVGGGPALGIFQCEPATHDDIWTNYLAFRSGLASRIEELLAHGVIPDLTRSHGRSGHLVFNLAYAAAICRVHYYRAPFRLSAPDDLAGMARAWKRFYNTEDGKGTEAEFIDNYERYVRGRE